MIIDRTINLQQHLARDGYDPGPVDGDFGPKTLQAAVCAIVPGAPDGVGAKLWPQMAARDIVTPLRIIYFLANCAAESGFQPVAENLNYSGDRLTEVWPRRFPNAAAAAGFVHNPQQLANAVYGGRMGNNRVGDGYKYRGRGWCQLTGKDAYQIIGEKIGADLVANPDYLLTQLGAAEAACAFWQWKAIGPAADQDDGERVRIRWNGGVNGLPQVMRKVGYLKVLWGLSL